MQPERVYQVRPPLQHYPALFQVLSMVVGGPHFVARGVGQLALNPVSIKTVGVQESGGGRPECVAAEQAAVSQPIQYAVDRRR